MQKYDKDQIIYSPSDLVTFLGCRHAILLDLKTLNKDIDKNKISSTNQLLQKKGLKHEIAYLQQLKDEGKSVVEIPKEHNLQNSIKLTLEAIRSGVDVIYQAVLFTKPWQGNADFLIKCNTPSDLGTFSYEILDTKLKKTAKPKHIIQLCVYSELLTNLQGLRPTNMHLFLGDEKHSFRIDDFFYYYTRTKTRFESYLQNPPAESYPEPCNHCNSCNWREDCEKRWKQDDHLSLVANIQKSQIDKLRKSGINTVAELATPVQNTKIADLNQDVFKRLRSQAILQHHKNTTRENSTKFSRVSTW